MRLSRWQVIVASIGAVILVAAAVSPALGGPSLRSLVKKEVKKQIAKKVGPQGPQGAQGAQGQAGSSNVTLVRTTLTVANNSNDSDFADCPAGQRATGGGVGRDGGGSFVNGDRLIDSQPVIGHTLSNPPTTTGSVATGWFGQIGTTGTGFTAYVWVLCVPNP
jgi:hypothetical protein